MIYYSGEFKDQFGTHGELFKLRGSVVPTALVWSVPSGCLAFFLCYAYNNLEEGVDVKADIAANSIKASQLWAALTAGLAFMVGFRTNKAYQRFWDGTTLLNQMFGEWFDASSCLFAFSHLPRNAKAKEVNNFRQTLVRLMSLMHGSALEEISQTDHDPEGYPCIDVGGLDYDTLKWLRDSKLNTKDFGFNRVEVIIHMVQVLIVHYADTGVLKIPPPILSRVFQTISRGQVNLANCKKITMTLFPFPYAQLIKILLMVLCILTPVTMASLLEKPHWAFVFTVIPLFGFAALNLVAKELELPFGDDANDLPLLDFHTRMNQALLMLIRKESDIIAEVSDLASEEYFEMKEKISTKRPRDFLADRTTEREKERIATLEAVRIEAEAALKAEEDAQAAAEAAKQAEAAKPSQSTADTATAVPAAAKDAGPAPTLLSLSVAAFVPGAAPIQSQADKDLGDAIQKKVQALNCAFDTLTEHLKEMASHSQTASQTLSNSTTSFEDLKVQLCSFQESILGKVRLDSNGKIAPLFEL